MKPLVIYHANCADGFGAAFAAWLKLGDGAEYVPMQYGQESECFYYLEDGSFDSDFTILNREIYILDFSFPKRVMEGLFALAKRVVWLDHHASVFKDWNIPLSVVGDNAYFSIEDTSHYVRLDNSKSGALLAWEFFHPAEVPLFIRHIDDYDRWQFKIEGTKAFNKALWSYAPWSFEQWEHERDSTWGYSSADGLEGMTNFIREGNAILRAHDQNVQSVVKGSARKCSIVPAVIDSNDSYKAPWVWWHDEEHGDTCGVNGLAANCPPHLTSDVGHELATQSGTFGLCWTLSKEGLIAKCSLRSNGDYDVSAIAKTFGGGGHRNAAGFEVDIQTLLGWLK